MNEKRSARRDKTLATGISPEEPESTLSSPLDNGLQGTMASGRRALVRFTRKSTVLGDDDNMPESYKWLRDWLRHAGLIIGDAPGQIQTEYKLEKVTRRKEVGTIVEIIYLDE